MERNKEYQPPKGKSHIAQGVLDGPGVNKHTLYWEEEQNEPSREDFL